MLSPRWRKLGRDLWEESNRVLLMVLAVAVSLVAVTTVLGTYAVLTREIRVNYLGTRPASATLELEEGVSPELVEAVRHQPGIAEAEAREVVQARVQVGKDWHALLLFVVEDFRQLRLNAFSPQSGAWPPPEGTMLIERQAVGPMQAGPGQTVLVKAPHGPPTPVPISGLTYDPGLSPAWQEVGGYGYITRTTLGRLGEPPVMHELRVAVREQPFSRPAIQATTAELAKWLAAQGHPVHQIRIPPPGRHPHQSQMETILLMMLVFALLALMLSGILVATSLSAMLARQVREIGVMKTVGARSVQIAAMYLVFVVVLGVGASVLAWPVGIAGARGLSQAVASMLNFDLTSLSVPGWVFAVQALAGVGVPILVATFPIRRASRTTVREAIDQHGVSADSLALRFSSLPPALRNALRRPARLGLTLGLLAAGGAMFMTALNVRDGWQRNIDRFYEGRHYDVEVRFTTDEPIAQAARLREVPGVREVEPWGYSPAAFARPGQVDVVATYPDRGHASFAVFAPPPQTKLIDFPLLGGRWLQPGDTDAVVLNHSARAQAHDPKLGDTVDLSIDGKPGRFRVVGFVEEIGYFPVAYVTDAAFAKATGTAGKTRMLRIVTDAGSDAERLEIIRAVEHKLGELGLSVEQGTPLSEHGRSVGGHVLILIRTLMAMAVVMAIVGMLGLASTMGVSVMERAREFGVMKTIGATPGRVMRLVIQEALFIGGLSWFAALAISVPVTIGVDRVVGYIGFLAPLPLCFPPAAALTWLGLVVAVSLLATMLPARRASKVTVREALAQL